MNSQTTDGEKIYTNVCLTKKWCLGYTKKICNSISRKGNSTIKNQQNILIDILPNKIYERTVST